MKHTVRKLLADTVGRTPYRNFGLPTDPKKDHEKVEWALYYSDEILAMKDGNLLAAGAPEEVITKDLIEEVFDVPLELREVDGKPFVLPI